MDIDYFDPKKIKSFAQITEWREFEKKVERKSRNNIKGLLVEIYEKPTHFIYELLQNADDAGAKRVSFELTGNELLFFHDGQKDFDLKDIYGITAIAYIDSEKRKSQKAIGKFGVGFKSVFAVTKIPYIYNRAYNFRIEDFTIPYEEPSINLGAYTTLIKIPFTKIDKFSKTDIVKRILDEFSRIDVATVMFLKTIESVTIKYKSNTRNIKLARKHNSNYEIITDASNPSEKYLSFKDKKTHTSIVFKANDKGTLKIWAPKVYSFLPTDEDSELSFYVDAPFDLKINRGMIDFEEKKNQEILSNIRSLYSKTLEKLRDSGYINQNFLDEILPVDKEIYGRSVLYDTLYDQTKIVLQDTNLLPTMTDKFINAKKSVLYSDSRMPELLKRDVSWLNLNMHATNIRTFLKDELNVKSLDIVDFSKMIIPKLNGNTSKEWLYKYYELCSDKIDNYIWSYRYDMKRLPIIMTRNGKFRSAYNTNGEELLFRPSKGLQPSQVINNLFIDIKDEDRRHKINHLLNSLEIGTRTPAQTIQKTILSKWKRYTEEEKVSKFFEINNLYNTLSREDKKDVERTIIDQPIFRCTVNGHTEWNVASKILIGTEDQRLLYEKRNIPILDKKFYIKNKIIGEKEIKGSEDLCTVLGVVKGFPLYKSDYYYDYNYKTRLNEKTINKYKIPTKYYSYWWSQQEKKILYLEDILKDIKTTQQTSAIINLLSAINDREAFIETIAGCTSRGYAPHDPKDIPAHFIRVLNNAKWIIRKDNKYATNNISKSDFIKQYKLSGYEAFLEWLDFIPEAIEQLPPEQQEFHKLFTSLSPDKQKKYLQDMQKDINTKDEKQPGIINDEEETEIINIENDFPALSKQLIIKNLNLKTLQPEDIIGNKIGGNRPKTKTAGSKNNTPEKPQTDTKDMNHSKEQKYKGLESDVVIVIDFDELAFKDDNAKSVFYVAWIKTAK